MGRVGTVCRLSGNGFLRFTAVRLFVFKSALLCCVQLAWTLAASSAQAQTHTITNCTEEALLSAMDHGGIVRFACDGTINLTRTLTNAFDTTLDGNGHAVTISGMGQYRVFYVTNNTHLTLLNVRITDGRSVSGGAGVYNDGGRLTILGCSFSNNLVQNFPWNIPTASVGSNVFGGALFNSGWASIANSSFVSNTAAGGIGGEGTNRSWTACGHGGNAGGGGNGFGGAIYNLGELVMSGCALFQNSAIGGAGGAGGRGGSGCIGGGDGGFGGPGGHGWGGGLFNSGVAHLVNTTFAANSGVGGPGDDGGSGGGTFSMYGGDGGDGNVGGSGFGAAIYDQTGACVLTNCTVALNTAVAGPGGRAGYGGSANYGNGASGIAGLPGQARSGGLDSNEASLLVNVLLSENLPENLAGSYIDAGHNLSSDNSDFTEPGSLTNTLPLLSPLASYGGPTPTLALMPGSPAIDAGDSFLSPAIDQRGEPRPIGQACDVGAYEAGRPDIVASPLGLWTPLGSGIELSAEAAGYSPLTYLWFFNATNLVAVTENPVLWLTNMQFSQSGEYTVVVTNQFGVTISSSARIEVFSRIVTRSGEDNLRAALSLGGIVTFTGDNTITLSRPLIIETNTTLEAGPHQIVISGGGLTQLFHVSTNVAFNVSGVKLTQGLGTNGGAIWSAGELRATNCVFSLNAAQGRPGDYQSWPPVGNPGLGGAVCSLGSFIAESCSFFGNAATGGRGTQDVGGPGGPAAGGAIYSVGALLLSRSVLASNSIAGGTGGIGRAGMAGGDQAWPGEPGGAGGNALGAAVFDAGEASLVNCTVAWNIVAGGIGGPGGPGGSVWHDGWHFTAPPGPNGAWGASQGTLYSTNSHLQVTNCTIAYNLCTFDPGSGQTISGALTHDSALMVNTILANNFPSNNSGLITDLGHNLSSDESCVFAGSGSKTNVDPQLGALADHAGPTFTVALLPGSPAIDAAEAALAPFTDQRGGSRSAAGAPDIGAYEYGSMPILSMARAGAGELELTLSEILVPTCRLQTSTNFTDWITVDTNSVGPDGTAAFRTAVDTNHLRKFYRIALP